MRDSILALCVQFLLVATSAGAQSSAVLTGHVRDETSAPIAKVSVTLSSLERVLQKETGADGDFQFAGVPPGAYELEVSVAGFVKQNLAVTLSSGDTRSLNIHLAVGSVPDVNVCGPHPSIHYDPPDPSGRRIAGILRDYADSKPIAKAEVALLRADEKKPVLLSTSDLRGKFELSDPPAGRYTLRVSRSGYRQTALKDLLLPRDNGAFIDLSILKRKAMVACE